MNVLLSVKPQFADRIFDGSKKYEYRKTTFSRTDILKVVVYASSPINKIIGEFEIAEILRDTPESIWTRTAAFGGVNRDFFFQYFAGKNKACAISIEHARRYEFPLNPREVLRNFTPPQSFMYLDNATFSDFPSKGQVV